MHLNRLLKTLLVTATGALLAGGVSAAPTLKGKDTTSFHVSAGSRNRPRFRPPSTTDT